MAQKASSEVESFLENPRLSEDTSVGNIDEAIILDPIGQSSYRHVPLKTTLNPVITFGGCSATLALKAAITELNVRYGEQYPDPTTMNMQFIRPSHAGHPIVITVEIIKAGRNMAHTAQKAVAESDGSIIWMAQIIFSDLVAKTLPHSLNTDMEGCPPLPPKDECIRRGHSKHGASPLKMFEYGAWYHGPEMLEKFSELEASIRSGKIHEGNPLVLLENITPAAYYEFKDREVDYLCLPWLSDLLVFVSSGTVMMGQRSTSGSGTMSLTMNFFNPLRDRLPYVKYSMTEMMDNGRAQLKANIYAPDGVRTPSTLIDSILLARKTRHLYRLKLQPTTKSSFFEDGEERCLVQASIVKPVVIRRAIASYQKMTSTTNIKNQHQRPQSRNSDTEEDDVNMERLPPAIKATGHKPLIPVQRTGHGESHGHGGGHATNNPATATTTHHNTRRHSPSSSNHRGTSSGGAPGSLADSEDGGEHHSTTKKKKKSKKSVKKHPNALTTMNSHPATTRGDRSLVANRNASPHYTPNHQHASSASKPSDIWYKSDAEEKLRIREFWLELTEDERRALVKLEKEAVLKKMKEQQKQTCSCSVCGRKRTVIEEELEILYDAYYEELENFTHDQARSSGRKDLLAIPHPHAHTHQHNHNHHHHHHHHSSRHHSRSGSASRDSYAESEEEEDDDEEDDDEDVDDEDDDDDDGDDDDDDESGESGSSSGIFEFGNSLTVKDGNILTVADDFLKNDGRKFLELMEQLAERKMKRLEEDEISNGGGQQGNGSGDGGDDSYEEDDEYDDDDEEDTMTEEQRMEEGRRMFQIFAAKMFEQRVLQAYREKVAQERQQRFLEELEEEERQKEAQAEAKQKNKEKKKQLKKAQKQQKDEEKLQRDREKAAEEEKVRLDRERAAEAERLKREAERQKREEERLKKEESERQKQAAAAARKEEEKRRRREEEDKRRKEKEEREKVERERREQEQRERDERERVAIEQRRLEDERQRLREEAERREHDRRDAEERARLAKAAAVAHSSAASSVSARIPQSAVSTQQQYNRSTTSSASRTPPPGIGYNNSPPPGMPIQPIAARPLQQQQQQQPIGRGRGRAIAFPAGRPGPVGGVGRGIMPRPASPQPHTTPPSSSPQPSISPPSHNQQQQQHRPIPLPPGVRPPPHLASGMIPPPFTGGLGRGAAAAPQSPIIAHNSPQLSSALEILHPQPMSINGDSGTLNDNVAKTGTPPLSDAIDRVPSPGIGGQQLFGGSRMSSLWAPPVGSDSSAQTGFGKSNPPPIGSKPNAFGQPVIIPTTASTPIASIGSAAPIGSVVGHKAVQRPAPIGAQRSNSVMSFGTGGGQSPTDSVGMETPPATWQFRVPDDDDIGFVGGSSALGGDIFVRGNQPTSAAAGLVPASSSSITSSGFDARGRALWDGSQGVSGLWRESAGGLAVSTAQISPGATSASSTLSPNQPNAPARTISNIGFSSYPNPTPSWNVAGSNLTPQQQQQQQQMFAQQQQNPQQTPQLQQHHQSQVPPSAGGQWGGARYY
ncbi:hypothetical protein SmJEL517_g06034 [Synchytrium microbalum]|uniref:Stress response protein NST1 n=1 Tax=Synchytrium microbalum TaxID=1806994 RepID=A0A507BRM4_9FUNG|nr:uncharacterized protein SmJEL517_g06034 [Synchytrium microbalum]TPX30382.1 hypothetical protein SmJEL517_g06034 [Synchytrium microbalum]